MTTPRDESGMDPAVARLLRQPPVIVVPEPPLWREPVRAVVALATVVTVITANLPWLVRTVVPPPEVVNGRGGYADGALLAITAVAATVTVLNRDAARSGAWLMRWLPAILGVVAATFIVSAIRSMENQVLAWKELGGGGAYQPWFFACLGAGAIVAVCCGWISLARRHG